MKIQANNSGSIDLEKSSNQYLRISDGDQVGLDISGDMTVELWVKAESHPVNDGAVLVGKSSNSGSQWSYLVSYYTDASSNLYLQFGNSSNGSYPSKFAEKSTTLNINAWYHLAYVYDASEGSITFYKNGENIGTETGLATSNYNSSADFTIGSYIYQSTAVNFFDGLIDDVM